MMRRRGFLLGATALFVAPAIVRASSLMPVSVLDLGTTDIMGTARRGPIVTGPWEFSTIAEWMNWLGEQPPLTASHVYQLDGYTPDAGFTQ